jgi:hypothetical protein
MLEYVFFHKTLAQKFLKLAKSLAISATLVEFEPEWEVHLPEDIADDV